MFPSKLPDLHMIGNAHLDPVWQWRWSEGCAEAIGTCWAAVDLLDEEPGFIFTRGDAVIYRWIEELEPVLFARIQFFVRQGRWVLVNGWWLQPDCNLPDGEAFLRQALYGKRYFWERFGVDVTVGYNVDSFGHAGTLPMVLRHTGFDSYVFSRPGMHEKMLPDVPFDWIAPNGSRVCAFRLPDSYHTVSKPLIEKMERIETLMQQSGYPLMCFYGIGNHGGGPTRENLATIRKAQGTGRRVIFSDPVRYFTMVAPLARPEVRDELQMHAIGCYSTLSAIKALNRRAEARLALAESASVLALWHAETPYPQEQLRRLWEVLLFNQFHDILGGVCIASASSDTIEALGGIIQETDKILNTGLRRLAATVAPVADRTDVAFLVFNLTGTEQYVPIEYEPWLNRQSDPRRLLDHAGKEMPYQELSPEGLVPSLGLRRLLFTACVPSFGYRLYRFAIGTPDPSATSTLRITPNVIENAIWRLEIDPKTGGIAGLTDKRDGRAVFSNVANLPIAVDDPSDTWGHGLDRFDFVGISSLCERIEVVEQGPLRAGLRVHARISNSTVTSTYYVYDDPLLPLEIRMRINWQGRNQLLRLRYPLSFSAPAFRHEVPAGSMERPADGREWPGQRWVLVSGTDGYGLTLVNDAKYSYAAESNTLYITALRSPVYAHHDPYILQPNGEYLYTDQGEQEFTLRLLAGNGIGPLTAHHLADELLRPPVVTPHVSRGGIGPHYASLLSIKASSSLVTWLKASEDGTGLILRFLEVEGRSDTVVISTVERQEYDLPPYSILTLHSDRQGQWRLSNGLEA